MAIQATGQGGAGCHQNIVVCCLLLMLHFYVCLFVRYLDIKEFNDIPAPPATSKRPVTDSLPGIWIHNISFYSEERKTVKLSVKCQIKDLL